MTNNSHARGFIIATAFALTLLVSATGPGLTVAQRRAPDLNISPEEQNLAKAIIAAPDAAAKLKAAGVLINKYPKTLIRPRVAESVADQIADDKDAAQRIQLAADYQKIFNEESEQALIVHVIVGAYADAGQADQAFSTGAAFLAKHPDSLRVLVRLALASTDEAKKKNNKFVDSGIQYGNKAIEIIEADKKPEDMNDALWNYYKSLRPNLYQSVASLSLVKGNHAEAKVKFTKAIELMPGDPFNYLMLGGILNDEYRTEAQRVQGLPEGTVKQDALQKVLAMLDIVIDAYAHMIAVSESDPRFAQVSQQYLQDLEAYYKYRHHSTEGLKELIAKYKVAPK